MRGFRSIFSRVERGRGVGYVDAVTEVRSWLILRGLTREKRQWGAFPSVLRQKSGDKVEVRRLDLPGIASASDRPAPLSVAAMVEDLNERFEPERAETPGPWGLLGVSLGGMVTLEWTRAHPELFSAAVVVNSSSGNTAGLFRRLRPANLTTLMRAARAQGAERELVVLGMNTTRHGDDRALAEEWAGYRAEAPVTPKVLLGQLVAGLRYWAPRRLTVPTLFVSGRADRFVDPICTRRLARRFRARHLEHPDAGHDLPLDEPEWLAEHMLDFAPPPTEEVPS